MSRWVVIGVPASAGAHHAGQERAPAALRAAGLIDALRAAGETVTDAGDLPGAVFAPDAAHPAARNLAAVSRVAREVADAVAAHLEPGHPGDGALPLVLGGDCTITLGVIAGFRRRHPGVGLAYVDGDADLSGALGGDDSGILDSAGVAHLLGHGPPELAGLAGPAPLLAPDHLTLIGGDPRETTDAGRDFLARAGVRLQEAPVLMRDPVMTARRGLTDLAAARASPVVVHFDVDAVDSADLPLANFPHYGSGVTLDAAVACLRTLRTAPAFGGLVLTEVNPTHDPDGAALARYVSAITEVITGRPAPPPAGPVEAGPVAAGPVASGGMRFADLSHEIRDGMVTIPGFPVPRIRAQSVSAGLPPGRYAPGVSFAIGEISMCGNTSTYLDSPRHLLPDGPDLAGLPLDRLAGLPGTVVDLTGLAGRAIGPDLLPRGVAGHAVLLRTGWEARWGTGGYHGGYPFLTADAARRLVADGAALVGIDAPNVDDTDDPARPAHAILLRAGVAVCEHLASLAGLPAAGFRFTAVPPKVAGFGTFPVRAFATW